MSLLYRTFRPLDVKRGLYQCSTIQRSVAINRHYPSNCRVFSTNLQNEKSAKNNDTIIPGTLLCAGTAAAGFKVAAGLTALLGIPVSGIPTSILLGVAVGNTFSIPQYFKPGIVWSTKTILQAGVVAVAAKLDFVQLLSTGSGSIPVVLAAVGSGLFVIPRLGRLAGLDKETTALITAGTSICGVTAITALAPAIKAPPKAVATAVANTVAFGTIGMLGYPYMFHEIFTVVNPNAIGMSLGVAIHDTSQVLGSALSYQQTFGDDSVLQTATVTKLTRNLGLAAAIPLLTINTTTVTTSSTAAAQSPTTSNSTLSGLVAFTKYVPNFLIAFLGVSATRSVATIMAADNLETLLQIQTVASFLGDTVAPCALGTAMAGVGLSTSVASLKGVGWKPFAVGGAGALTVGGCGTLMAYIMTATTMGV